MENQIDTKTWHNPLSTGIDLDEIHATERKRVLVVEDEIDTIFLLKHILRLAGFNVLGATSGREALKKCAELKPDLVLLDLMMPEMDGWQTYDYLRRVSNVPVIIISALGSKEEVVRALQTGVDDYVTKPFYNAEVVARVNAVLRRSHKPQDLSRLIFPQVDLVVDCMTQEVDIAGEHIQLTSKEFAVLAVLAKHAPAIVSYATIADAVWGEDTPEVRKRTKYLVYLLRRKFERIPGGADLILNVDRLGYKLQTEA